MTNHDILTVNVTQAVADFYPGLSDERVEFLSESIIGTLITASFMILYMMI